LALERSLVEILHEHNNDYYRAQNGWSGDTWNQMAKIFQERNKHVTYTKSQIQDKEKELKREYKMLKEARMQSGASWCEKSCRIQADQELWDNLLIVSFSPFLFLVISFMLSSYSLFPEIFFCSPTQKLGNSREMTFLYLICLENYMMVSVLN
jgi:hypothetical protein